MQIVEWNEKSFFSSFDSQLRSADVDDDRKKNVYNFWRQELIHLSVWHVRDNEIEQSTSLTQIHLIVEQVHTFNFGTNDCQKILVKLVFLSTLKT